MGEERNRAARLQREIQRLEERETELRSKWNRATQEEEACKETDFWGRKLYEQLAEAWSGDSGFVQLLEENIQRLRSVERERSGMLEKCDVNIRREMRRIQDEQRGLAEKLRDELEG